MSFAVGFKKIPQIFSGLFHNFSLNMPTTKKYAIDWYETLLGWINCSKIKVPFISTPTFGEYFSLIQFKFITGT